MEDHGWSKQYKVDILDAEGPDLKLDIPNGKVIKNHRPMQEERPRITS